MAVEDDTVLGVLPMAYIRSRLFGKSMTSLPFLDYAGAVAVNETSLKALLGEAYRVAEAKKAAYVAFRQRSGLNDNLFVDSRKVLSILQLNEDEDEFRKSLPSERRNRIRKASASGLVVERSSADRLNEFYKIWTTNMRDLGSPPHSLRFFEMILEQFPDSADLLLVRLDRKFIGAALCLTYKDSITVPWVSSLREYFGVYPNIILYWEIMRLAIGRGLTYFDFGRSSLHSGTHSFKTRWGAHDVPLYWEYKVFPSHKTDVKLPSGDDERFDLVTAAWKRIPVAVANIIGPPIRKSITS
jgi:FemAB-related protein (PEP-CTERM system-associated)